MKCKAYGKVNLALDVVSRREDGFHELEMIMAPIDLFDTIDIEIAEQMSITSNKSFIPADRKNTIINVLEYMREEYHFKENFNIKLMKNIPSQAGLGGGSADAAVAMRMVNEMLNLEISLEELCRIGAQAGSDIPFCLVGKPAHVSGVGDKIVPFKINCPFYLFLVKPNRGVSTRLAFKNLDMDNLIHPDCSKVQKALEEGNYEEMINSIGNSLEVSASTFVASLTQIKEELLDFGFDTAVMSGSGSTIFGVTTDEKLVDKAYEHFWDKYSFVKKSKIVTDSYANNEIIKRRTK